MVVFLKPSYTTLLPDIVMPYCAYWHWTHFQNIASAIVSETFNFSATDKDRSPQFNYNSIVLSMRVRFIPELN